jgi:hypothetical protein
MLSYRMLAHLADDRREGQPADASAATAAVFSAILDRLGG